MNSKSNNTEIIGATLSKITRKCYCGKCTSKDLYIIDLVDEKGKLIQIASPRLHNNVVSYSIEGGEKVIITDPNYINLMNIEHLKEINEALGYNFNCKLIIDKSVNS